MDYFEYKNGALRCEDVPVEDIARHVGTPVYIYSAATLLHHYRAITEAFAELKPTVCFSVKSLGNVQVLRLLAEAGSGFDVVSGGELARVLAAGGDARKVAFAGVGKTDREIREAIDAGIMLFNVESEQEFENLSRLAAETGKRVRAALRINPDVYDPATHRYTTTGKKATKFGVDIDRAEQFFDNYGHDDNVLLDGVDMHIGSPIYSAEPYVQAIRRSLELIDRLRAKGQEISLLDLGGGFAADYEQGASPLAADYAERILPLLRGRDLQLVLEPGRQIACNAGVLVTTVQYVKQGGDKRFVICDAAMNDMLRPALYDAEHFAYPVRLREGERPPHRSPGYSPDGAVKVDLVGGVCETSDFLARDRMLPPMKRGDLVSVFSAGAYGFVMSSQYNARPRAAEVLVRGDWWRIVRRRETYDDLLAPETMDLPENPAR
ncbi:MAG: diaminopimelate decarboxylase [Phycisphaerae bacterium]